MAASDRPKMHRITVSLTDEQYQFLKKLRAKKCLPISTLIRLAIDSNISDDSD
jgi:predicted DNA binding CopG/RHH family protein